MADRQHRLTAAIADQPVQEYRFRFVTERARSILYSRQPWNRSRYVTAYLSTNRESVPYVKGPVTVTVSTVSSEGLIHPYYLVGSGCTDGVFRARLEMPSSDLDNGQVGVWVELRDMAIFCVKRSEEALREAIEIRLRSGVVPFHHQHNQRAHEVYSRHASLMDKVHLAFVFHHEQSGQDIRIVSDLISRAPRVGPRSAPKPLVMPDLLPLVPEQKAWLHIEGLARSGAFDMLLTSKHHTDAVGDVQYTPLENMHSLLQLVLRLRPDLTLTEADRVQLELHISEAGTGANEHLVDVFFHRLTCPQCSARLPCVLGLLPQQTTPPPPPPPPTPSHPTQPHQHQQQQQQQQLLFNPDSLPEQQMSDMELQELIQEISTINDLPQLPQHQLQEFLQHHQQQFLQQQQQQQQQ